jgi:ATP-dependent protease ClpP protease subunit
MNTDTFDHIVCQSGADHPASIRFFGKITEESASRFNEAFEFLECVVRPSLIRVLINSEGGSVLHGMTVYATIQNSSIPTECVIEGMAASMGSVVWAAGNKSLMRDYGILMIHNPFMPEDEAEAPDLVKAFTSQIETIYRKRFNLSREKVRAIMDGEAGRDGTFFDAATAVKAGIIPESHVLKTSKQLRDKVQSDLSGVTDVAAIQSVMSHITPAGFAPEIKNHPSDEKNTNLNTNTNKMAEMNEEKTLSPEYSAVIASLGMQEKHEVKDVLSRITELTGVEARLTDTTKALSDAQTVIAGKDATIGNLQKDLEGVTARLQKYEKQEADQKAAAIQSFLQKAADDGKIEASTIPSWVEMASTNFELVQSTINSVPAREKISEEIAADPANALAAAAAMKSAEEKLAEKVAAVVGEKFEFKTLK